MATADLAQVLRWLADPLAFTKAFWPEMRLYDKQAEIMRAVVDTPEVFCHSANETGKTRLAALLIIWFLASRFPARIIASSSSNRQLKNALWPETVRLIRQAQPGLGIEVKDMELGVTDPKTGLFYPEHFAKFYVTDKAENFQGPHEPETGGVPRVFVIFEEASGVGDEFYHAAQTMAHRILAIGNPLSTSTFYFRECKRGDEVDEATGRLYRRVVHMDGRDSPNVKAGRLWAAKGLPGSPPEIIPGLLSYAHFLHREQTWSHHRKLTRLYGQFDEGHDAMMFPSEWLDEAEAAWPEVCRQRATEGYRPGPRTMGVDVAEGGRDLSAWVVLDRLGVVDVRVMRTPDTSVIPAVTVDLMRKWGIAAMFVCFDRGAGGKEHADLLRQRGHRVRAIGFGEAARDSKTYRNRRAEMYGTLRGSLNPAHWSKVSVPAINGKPAAEEYDRCLALPPDGDPLYHHELREELAMLPMMTDNEGKTIMPPKSHSATARASGVRTIEEIIGRSPDRADALVLARWAMIPLRPPPPRVSGPLVPVPQEEPPLEPESKRRKQSRLEELVFGPE